MKKIVLFSLIIPTLFITQTALAQSRKADPNKMPPTQKQQQEPRLHQQGSPDDAKIQIQQTPNENEAATDNNQAGESGRPMKEEQVSPQPAQRNNQNQVKQRSLGSNRSEVARQHMSQVATQVQKMLAAGNEDPGIGPKVREIAKNQQKTQSKINKNMEELDQRKKWVKSLIGPNYEAMEAIDRELEVNQERIEQLQELKAEAQTEAAQLEIEQTTQALQDQNQSLSQVMEQERSQFSLLGWLFRRINS